MLRSLFIRVLPLFLLALIAGGWGLRAQASAVEPSVLTLTKQDDTADGMCDSDCSLREAVIAANADDDPSTIVAPASANHYLVSSGFGGFDILTPVTIQGPGAAQTIIDGNASDTVFHVLPGGYLTLQGVTVENGKGIGSSLAGGIYAEGGLTLDSSAVMGNNGGVTGGAGGIYSDDDLRIMRSEISGNTSGDQGAGGIFADWDTEISHSTISGNTASGVSSVGGFYFEANGELSDVTISGNQASGENSVGGLYTYFSSDMTLTRVTIADNQANGNYAVGGWWNFAEVKAADMAIDGNHGGLYGQGGLYVECCDGRLELSRATISNNTAPDNSGGGFDNEGESTLTNVTVSGNTAGTNSSGGLYNSGTLIVGSSTIANNTTAGTSGAGGFWNDATATVQNTIIAGNAQVDCLNTVTITSQGGNFSSHSDCGFDDPLDHQDSQPLLDPLGFFGGFGDTHPLHEGSPAIDAAVGCPPPETDERGVTRPPGLCDSGAFEVTHRALMNRTWGDILCNGGAAADDALNILYRRPPSGPVSVTGCPPPDAEVSVLGWFKHHFWGDLNCDGNVSVLDALYILRSAAGIPLTASVECPDIEQLLTVSEPVY